MKRFLQGLRPLDRPLVLGAQAGGVGAAAGALLGLTGGVQGAVEGAASLGIGVAVIVIFMAYVAAYRFQQMRRDGEERGLVLWFFRSRADDDISFRFRPRS